jgi:Lipoprotein LpqB beta-propeller domain/Sporulation and spore germination
MITSRRARRAAAGLAGRRRAGAGGRVAIAAVAVAVAAGGCATVPTSGAVEQVGGADGGYPPQDYPQPIPVGPGPGWSPAEIVAGFLAASASFANNHQVAREYLDPTAQDTWSPTWAVTVFSGMTTGPPVCYPKQYPPDDPCGSAKVVVTGLRVATLTNYGLPQTLPSPKESVPFSLTKINGQWRITNPPQYLLLNQDDFKIVYQPRNIYFLDGSGRALVPDPVFVPQQDTNTDLATRLVQALLQDPTGWLQGAATTGFPRGSDLIGNVKINGPNATVDLGGKAATADPGQQEQMAAQLAWTLASGPTAIQAVELEANGRPLQIKGSEPQLLQAYSNWMPTPSGGSSLYYIGRGGAVRTLSGVGPPGSGQLGRVTTVTGAAGTPGEPPLRSIAVSPDGRWMAGISTGGTTVYARDLAVKGTWREEWHSKSGGCTSLSWDPQDDLWIAASSGLWMTALGHGNGDAQPIILPPLPEVSAFRVAPDGVRAVMINGTQLQLVAITHSGGFASLGDQVAIGPGITDPEALSWYDANNVIVLDGSSSGGQLYEVPLNGDQPTPIASEGNVVSVTATSPPGSSPQIAVGLSDGQIMVSPNLGGAFESTRATGEAPAYPG